jgi:hypothetical protein
MGVDIVNQGLLSGSHDLVQDGSGLPGWLSGDPRLGPLQNNGGPTWTQALLPGSRAIDAGDNALVPAGVSTDQRGQDRFVNGITDLGAFEFWPAKPDREDDANHNGIRDSGESSAVNPPPPNPLVAWEQAWEAEVDALWADARALELALLSWETAVLTPYWNAVEGRTA